jgi:hypothetical protein
MKPSDLVQEISQTCDRSVSNKARKGLGPKQEQLGVRGFLNFVLA